MTATLWGTTMRLIITALAALAIGGSAALAQPSAERGSYLVNTIGACSNCHTPPLYTNNKLTLARGFTPPAEPLHLLNIARVSVGTDPGLVNEENCVANLVFDNDVLCHMTAGFVAPKGLPAWSATFIGTQGAEEVSADEWATRLGTITYEVVCAISARVPRIVTGGP